MQRVPLTQAPALPDDEQEPFVMLTFRTGFPHALLVVMVVSAMACGGGSTGSIVAPTAITGGAPSAVGTYEGSWSGRTDQGQRVEFTVAGAVVTRFSTGVTYAASECTGSAGGGFGIAAVIADVAFAATSSVPIAGFGWSVVGRFTSPGEASGTFQMTFSSIGPSDKPPCMSAVEVTWTAEKRA